LFEENLKTNTDKKEKPQQQITLWEKREKQENGFVHVLVGFARSSLLCRRDRFNRQHILRT
jgi:hypothetical protein